MFYLSKEQLLELAKESNRNALSLRFADTHDYADFGGHWICFENKHIDIPQDLEKPTHYKITVTQSNNLSYSCRIKLVK